MTSPQPQPGDRASAADSGAAHSLVPTVRPQSDDDEVQQTSPVSRLPVEVDVVVPVRQFRVRDLLALEPGRLIESQWGNGEDLPLSAGEVQLAWSEFEVIDSQLAVRVTRLA
jgi:flagellar motor switch protein FliN/FliY